MEGERGIEKYVQSIAVAVVIVLNADTMFLGLLSIRGALVLMRCNNVF